MIITTDNYEEYFYHYCEGELNAEERAAVEAFAAQHPDLAEELSLYDPALKLEETPMPYPGKEGLMRHEAKLVPLWRWVAAACVAAVLLGGVWMLWPDGGQVEQGAVVAELHHGSPKAEPVEPALQQPYTVPSQIVAPAKKPSRQENPTATIVDEPLEQLPQYEPPTFEEPLLLADAELVQDPQHEDTTVIEYIDIIVFPTYYQSQVEVVEVAYQPTVGDRFRAFRSRVSNTVRDYAYQSYSEARGELLTRINY